MRRRSNPFPGSRMKTLRSPADHRRAQLLLDEIDGKITPGQADALRAVEREACAQIADAMACAPHDRTTAKAIAANIRARNAEKVDARELDRALTEANNEARLAGDQSPWP